jgi:hypothetical protein
VNALEEFRSLGIEFISLHEGVQSEPRVEFRSGCSVAGVGDLPELGNQMLVGSFILRSYSHLRRYIRMHGTQHQID